MFTLAAPGLEPRWLTWNDESTVEQTEHTRLFAGGGFTRLAQGIETLTSLTHLDVSRNKLTCLPDLSKLIHLNRLGASENLITTVGPLPLSLKYLDLCCNQVKSLPPLPQLFYLWARYNQISKVVLPCSLECVVLNHNQLVQVDLRDLHLLDSVMLSNNNLSQCPKLHSNCQTILIKDNPLIFPNINVRRVSVDKVCAAYFSKSRARNEFVFSTAPLEISYWDLDRPTIGQWGILL